MFQLTHKGYNNTGDKVPTSVWLFLFGYGLSMIGDATFRISLFWYVVNRLHMPEQTGILSAVMFLPAFLLAPYSGYISDRYISTKLASGILFLSFISLMYIAFFSYLKLSFFAVYWCIVIVSFSGCYLKSFSVSYMRNSLNDLHFEKCISYINAVYSAAGIIGPIIIALPLKIKSIPYESVFLFNGFSFLLFCLLMFFLPSPVIKGTKKTNDNKNYLVKIMKISFLKKESRRVFFVFLMINFIYGTIAIIMPVMFSKEFGEKASSLYGNAEIIGGIFSVLAAIFFKSMNKSILFFIFSSCVFCFVIFFWSDKNSLPLVLNIFIFFVSVYCTLQVINSIIIFCKGVDKDHSGGARSVLTMGQSLSAFLSGAFCSFLVNAGMYKSMFFISGLILIFVFFISLWEIKWYKIKRH